MASIAPTPLLQLRPLRSSPNKPRFVPRAAKCIIPSPPKAVHGRREWLLLLAAASTVTVGVAAPASAKDIPLFGLRKKMVNLEEEAVEIIKEGEKAVEKEIETVEKEVTEVEAEIEEAVAASNLAQAEALVVVEALAVLVATSIVNTILKPLAQKS